MSDRNRPDDSATGGRPDPATARLIAWRATPTGERWATPSGFLAAGVRDGEPVVAKVAGVEEERRGGRLMRWWGRHGGLAVLEVDGDALLLRRATGSRDLAAWSGGGRDDEAVDVLVDCVAALHALPAPPASVGLVPLSDWFRSLVAVRQTDPLLDAAASVARDLLTEPGPPVALHGDVHHRNVLDLDGHRFVAIDPKALAGPRAFDLANLFCNPTAAIAADRLPARLDRVADRAAIDRAVLVAWVRAWCGLSLTWTSGRDGHAAGTRAVLDALGG